MQPPRDRSNKGLGVEAGPLDRGLAGESRQGTDTELGKVGKSGQLATYLPTYLPILQGRCARKRKARQGTFSSRTYGAGGAVDLYPSVYPSLSPPKAVPRSATPVLEVRFQYMGKGGGCREGSSQVQGMERGMGRRRDDAGKLLFSKAALFRGITCVCVYFILPVCFFSLVVAARGKTKRGWR